jgi:hypothetical protein
VTLQDVLHDHGALSLEKQDALSDYLGEHSWWLDLKAGTVDFGGGRLFPIQVVGTESKGSGTWLWSWANHQSQIPAALHASAVRVREYGEAHGVREFVTPELAPGSFDGHMLSAAACGVAAADAYYLGHHEDGAVLLFLESPTLRQLIRPSVLHMTTIFTSFISAWEIADHRKAFVAYARAKGCTIHEVGARVEVTDPTGEQLAADFEDSGRLFEMETGPLGRPAKPAM